MTKKAGQPGTGQAASAVSHGVPAQIDRVRRRSRCLFNSAEVEAALDRMAAAITRSLADSNPVIICVMNGGVIVTGELATRLDFPLQMDYLHATRYREKTQGADLQWRVKPTLPLAGRTLLLIDDILDEGETLAQVRDYCLSEGCQRVCSAVLVNKRHARKSAAIDADFIGLETEDFYLFGYGMDFKGYLRNAPGIYAVHDDDL